MNVHLKYGIEGLDLTFPQTPNFKGVIYPDEATPLHDPGKAVQGALGIEVSELHIYRYKIWWAYVNCVAPTPMFFLMDQWNVKSARKARIALLGVLSSNQNTKDIKCEAH